MLGDALVVEGLEPGSTTGGAAEFGEVDDFIAAAAEVGGDEVGVVGG